MDWTGCKEANQLLLGMQAGVSEHQTQQPHAIMSQPEVFSTNHPPIFREARRGLLGRTTISTLGRVRMERTAGWSCMSSP